ncbi:hypothetical protein [Microbulbifer taiwanensis]|uniref:Uncharacterized protein n=1 Tax=Microbulbifer taiwanensis TaxID=986746 RepID=A0ABW1YUI8_9GAMM|nr:hypothetical protein [Microbulbifer taiwanensis]
MEGFRANPFFTGVIGVELNTLGGDSCTACVGIMSLFNSRKFFASDTGYQ